LVLIKFKIVIILQLIPSCFSVTCPELLYVLVLSLDCLIQIDLRFPLHAPTVYVDPETGRHACRTCPLLDFRCPSRSESINRQGLLRKPIGSCGYQLSYSQTPSVLSNWSPIQLFAQAQLTGRTSQQRRTESWDGNRSLNLRLSGFAHDRFVEQLTYFPPAMELLSATLGPYSRR
jgi:hypothetical protein